MLAPGGGSAKLTPLGFPINRAVRGRGARMFGYRAAGPIPAMKHARERTPDRHDPSPWVVRHAAQVPIGDRGTVVLDVAAGAGRHARFFLARGNRVVAVDRTIEGLRELAAGAHSAVVQAELEAAPWPFLAAVFHAIVVVNYLWRPLLPTLRAALAPGGVLIYETFGVGNERYGEPSNPDYLLREGELLTAFGDLDVADYEHGYVERPRPAVVQRLCAIRHPRRKEDSPPAEPLR